MTTILEKSLGAAAKGGTTTLNAVYHYAEPVTEKGFVFMDTPGYDPVSATGQVAGGANMLCFTTGRGSAYGCKPTPSIKLATNTPMYERMIDDMDINCGDILDGVTLQEKGKEIFEQDPARRVGREDQVGGAGLWRQRVRALADRRDDVVRASFEPESRHVCADGQRLRPVDRFPFSQFLYRYEIKALYDFLAFFQPSAFPHPFRLPHTSSQQLAGGNGWPQPPFRQVWRWSDARWVARVAPVDCRAVRSRLPDYRKPMGR